MPAHILPDLPGSDLWVRPLSLISPWTAVQMDISKLPTGTFEE